MMPPDITLDFHVEGMAVSDAAGAGKIAVLVDNGPLTFHGSQRCNVSVGVCGWWLSWKGGRVSCLPHPRPSVVHLHACRCYVNAAQTHVLCPPPPRPILVLFLMPA